jgi:hypothetical protein
MEARWKESSEQAVVGSGFHNGSEVVAVKVEWSGLG